MVNGPASCVQLLASVYERRWTNKRRRTKLLSFQFPDRGGGDPEIELDLDFTQAELPAYYDVNKPHKEMRAFPMPSGGLVFPAYYNNGNAAFMDTSLSWNELFVQFPSEYCQIDSSGINTSQQNNVYPLHVE